MSRKGRRQSSQRSTERPVTGAAAVEKPNTQSLPGRLPAIDALRGLAIAAMIGYHIAFDLRLFDLIRADFEHDRFWLGARAVIVASFLLLVGVSLVLAQRAGVSPIARWRRIGVIVACAAAASAASYTLFPRTWIYFGILHNIAISSILAWPLVRSPGLSLGIAVAAIVAGLAIGHPVFDSRLLSWIGLATVKPPTEDFVPLLPWFGVVLLGVAAGHQLARHGFAPIADFAGAPAWLRWMGRHSLAIYMVHQPLLIGALWLVVGR